MLTIAAIAWGVEAALAIGVGLPRRLAGGIGDVGLAIAIQIGALPDRPLARYGMRRRGT